MQSDSSSDSEVDERQEEVEEPMVLRLEQCELSVEQTKKEYDRLRRAEIKAKKDASDPIDENQKRRPGAGRKRKYVDSYVLQVDENGNHIVDANGFPIEKRIRSKSTPRNPALDNKFEEIRSKVRAVTKNLRMDVKAEIESLKKESFHRGIKLPETKQEYCNILNVVSFY